MTRYRSILFIIPAFYLYYSVVSYFGVILSDKYEIFPVFNWSLFTYVTDVRQFCEIEVVAIDGRSLEQPTPYYGLPDRFAGAKARNPTLFKLLQRACRAKKREDLDKFAALREVVETGFFGGPVQGALSLGYSHLQSDRSLARWVHHRQGSSRQLSHKGAFALIFAAPKKAAPFLLRLSLRKGDSQTSANIAECTMARSGWFAFTTQRTFSLSTLSWKSCGQSVSPVPVWIPFGLWCGSNGWPRAQFPYCFAFVGLVGISRPSRLAPQKRSDFGRIFPTHGGRSPQLLRGRQS